MILGVLGSQQRRRLSGGPAIPDGALAHLDFVAGTYYAGGATRNVQDVLGGGFDITSLEAKGMNVGQPTPFLSATNWPIAIGALFTAIASNLQSGGITLVYEFDVSQSIGQDIHGPVTNLFDDTDPDLAASIIYLEASGATPGGLDLVDERIGPEALSIFNAPTLNNEDIQKIAYTLARPAGGILYEYACSGNGAGATSQNLDYAPDYIDTQLITLFGVEGWDYAPDGPLYVRKMTVYPAIAAASLHEYSAVT